jgi:16S rRNA (guanine966-N2)-methyltransferase
MPDAGRVIAGIARGRRLVAPAGGTRPFGDRVKQALFATLEPALPGARVVDLFAGSGAGGIEALSRGAAACVFVEREAAAAATIEENLRRTGLGGPGTAVVRRDAIAFLAASSATWDLVLLDPPYGDPAMLAALSRLGAGTLLAPGGTVVAKHFWRDELPERTGRLMRVRVRRFGETTITLYRADAAPGGDAAEPGEGDGS